MKSFFLLGTLIFLSLIGSAQNTDELQIKEVLLQQVQSWNKGDLESYMSGYWQSDSLQFIGKNGIQRGWKNTLENYRKSYSTKEAMGTLNFSELSLKKLSSQYYFVTGHWHLARTVGDLQGCFSLLFEKINNHWHIVVDHSS